MRENLEVTLGRLSKQISDLEGDTIVVRGTYIKEKSPDNFE